MSGKTFLVGALLSAVVVLSLVLVANQFKKGVDPLAVKVRVKDSEGRLSRGRDLEARIERIEAGGALSPVTGPSIPFVQGAATEEGKNDSVPPESRIADLESQVSILAERIRGLEGGPLRSAYAFLTSQSEALRREGVKTLGKIARSDPEARAAIRKLLKDPAARVRLQALNALKKIRDKESIGEITALVEDPEAMVRRLAIASLGEIGGLEAAPMISQIMLSDPDESVRKAAAHAAGALKTPGAAEGLITLLKDHDEGVRGEAIASLGETGAAAATPLLRSIYDQDPGRNRTRLAMALKRLGDEGPFREETVRLSQSALNDPEPRARLKALRALASIARDDSQEVFTQALQDQSQEVRLAAEKAMKKKRLPPAQRAP